MSKETQNIDKAENGNDFIADVMPRFIVDERNGCIAIRDTHNPEFNNSEELNQDMPDVVDFEMGTRIDTGRFITWDLDPEIIKRFRNKCHQLNVV